MAARRRMLAALVVAGTLSQASQYLVSFLFSVAPERGGKYSIRAALSLSPYLFSMLVGYASGGPRALTQFLAGQAGGRVLPPRSRRARAFLLAGALATQALGTMLLSSARETAHIVCAQVVIGLGSGPLYPMGYAIVALSYDKTQLGGSNGVLSQTSYFGPALASLAVLVAREYGWRLTARAVAASLLAAACLVAACADDEDAVLPEKPPQRQRGGAAESWAAALVALGGGARYAAGYAVPSYVPYFFEQTYPKRMAAFSTANAVAIFACGSTSALAGGVLAQRWATRRGCGPRDYLVVPVLSCFGGGLFAALTFLARSFGAAVLALFVTQLLGEAWLAGTVAGLRLFVDDDAVLGAFYTVATFVGCLNLVVLGATVDAAALSLRAVMVLAVALPYFLALAFFAAAARLDRDAAAAPLKPAPPPCDDATPLLLERVPLRSASSGSDTVLI